MKQQITTKPSYDLVANVRFACYLPLGILILQQITQFFDTHLYAANGNPGSFYWLALNISNASAYVLPILGIVWGAMAWRRPIAKLAVAINVAVLIYFWAGPTIISTILHPS